MSVLRTAQADPPSYQSSEHGVRHRFPLVDSRGKQWGVLALESGARSATSTPLFYESDIIHGLFTTEVEKGDPMRSVTIKISGSVITGPMVEDRMTFLKLSTSLWTRTDSPPDVGRAWWPFSIPLPSEANIQTGGQRRAFPLPESFLERHTRVTVLYEISVTVARGMFRANNSFTTRFRYIPCTYPEPPSGLRQRAYDLHHGLPGPVQDPEGWVTSATALAQGRVFRTRHTCVQCTLSLACPLSYTRASLIPCWLNLRSGDSDALALLSAPSAPRVHLRRCVRYHTSDRPGIHTVQGGESRTDVASAVWWPRDDDNAVDDAAYTRTLEGEIRLPASLPASAAVGSFSISYAVDFLPPDCIGFTPTNDDALISVPVEIMTMYAANSPQPVAYAPPSYDALTTHHVASHDESVLYTSMGRLNMGR
ncbi:hypothetical protein DFH06DRAFT_1336336 [Mycena polygramma]|nr:hypothetical protein DFH06DRAFT_1336336 [Mycena polygramma]